MSKLYTITRKDYHQPQSFGAACKCSWTSTKWVAYHLSKGYRASSLHSYDVHTIDLATGTVAKCSAIAFLASLPQHAEKIKGEIQARLGLPLDLATLDALYRKGVLADGFKDKAREFLQSKGITV